ncbi:MAG: hypothetical protein ABFD08_04005 [Syntrophomonas sp.]
MQKDIKLIFHNEGLRSFIEVDLCRECPRQDDKGCCGYYSPVFYPSDFAYLLRNQPELMDYIFKLDNITVLDASVTVNNSIDGPSYRCSFHRREGGCLLPQPVRESVCRHFVCPGIDWQHEDKLGSWKEFFNQLEDYEITVNNKIAAVLREMDLSLRREDQREEFFTQLLRLFEEETASLPEFMASCPKIEEATVTREIKFGQDWPL